MQRYCHYCYQPSVFRPSPHNVTKKELFLKDNGTKDDLFGPELSEFISSKLLFLKDIGFLDFVKRIQLDRVYRR